MPSYRVTGLTFEQLEMLKAAEAIVQFAHPDYQYVVNDAYECPGYDGLTACTDDCVGYLSLVHVQFPQHRMDVHVKPSDSLDVVALLSEVA